MGRRLALIALVLAGCHDEDRSTAKGGEFGVRGWLKAVDIATGTVAWTAYSTGPDPRDLTA